MCGDVMDRKPRNSATPNKGMPSKGPSRAESQVKPPESILCVHTVSPWNKDKGISLAHTHTQSSWEELGSAGLRTCTASTSAASSGTASALPPPSPLVGKVHL